MTSTGREEVAILRLADVDAAAAASDEDTGALFAHAKSRVVPGLAGGDDADERRA